MDEFANCLFSIDIITLYSFLFLMYNNAWPGGLACIRNRADMINLRISFEKFLIFGNEPTFYTGNMYILVPIL